MELFSISCTTCKSRLKVREAAVIGQILACPKCGGMVMVKAPPGWEAGKPLPAPLPETPPGITAVVEMRRPNETLGDSQFDAVEDLLSDAPPKVKPSQVTVAADAPGLARPRFVGGPPASAPAANGNGKPHGAPHSAAAEAPPQPPKANGQPGPDTELPPPEWSNARPWRYHVLLAASIVAGIGLVIAVVIASRSLFSGGGETALVTPSPAPISPETPATTTPVIPPNTPNPAVVSPTEPVPTEPQPMPPAKPVPPQPPQKPEVDPLELTKPPMPAVNPPKAGPDPLEKFTNILAPEGDPIAKPEAPMPTATTPPVPMPEPTEPEKPVLPRPAPRTINVTARLADPLSGIETAGTPLVDFLQVMSDLSTIPITLEPDTVPFTKGATVTSPVALKLTGGTVGTALTTGLAPLGLNQVVVGNQLTVRLIEPPVPVKLNYPVKDLTGNSLPAAAELAATIQALTDPAAWQPGGGTIEITADTLKIAQRRAIHAETFFFCEKLRTARKLPYASTFSRSLFMLTPRSELAAKSLATPITLNFGQPTRLAQILQRLEAAAGVRILVDWLDVAAAGWNPDGEATLTVENAPLSEALTKLLEPMDLAWRVVDATTLQILTPATLGQRTEIEFYPAGPLVADDSSGQTLIGQVRQAIGGGPGEIRFDSPSLTLLASLPQPKQRELAALLAKMGAPAAPSPALPVAPANVRPKLGK